MNLTEEARQMRNAYAREQYRKNREREIKRQEDYWNRKAAERRDAFYGFMQKSIRDALSEGVLDSEEVDNMWEIVRRIADETFGRQE